MKNKTLLKTMLVSFACAATTSILPIALSSCSNPKQDDDSKSFKLTFDAGEGRITQGKSIVNVSKEASTTFGDIQKPTVEADGKIFTGWTVDNTEFTDKEPINKNLTIKANYVNDSLGLYYKVTFASETGVTLSGNTVVAVKKNHPFFTVNRPTAAKDNCVFKHWSTTSGGDKYPESSVISDNVTLYPVFTEQVTLTFGQPTSGTVTYYGPTTVNIASGAAFSTAGRPTATSQEKYFAGWYYDAACETTPVVESAAITENKTIYPKMTDELVGYSSVTFAAKDTDTGVTFSGNTVVYFKTDSMFSEVIRPLATRTGYVFRAWQKRTGSAGSYVYTDLTASDVLSNGDYVCPAWTLDAEIAITGDSKIYTSSISNAYGATIYPASARGTNITFAISNWTGTAATTPTVDSTTKQITTLGGKGTFDLTASTTLSSGTISAKVSITVADPIEDSSDFWIYDDTNSIWIQLDKYSVYKSTSEITGKKPDGTTYTVGRSGFDKAVYVGKNVTKIEDDFLAGCSSLNTAPIFATDGAVASIGDNFMVGCSSFNKPITLPTTITSIGDNFMNECTSFNSQLQIPNVTTIGDYFLSGCTAFNNGSNAFTMPSVTAIGQFFLSNCNTFNSSLTLPSGLLTIGQGFMMYCTAFNQALAIPSTVTAISTAFMYDCQAFVATLTLNANPSVFASSDQTLTTTNTSAACYVTGLTIGGTAEYITAFKTKFPANTTGEFYRKYAS